jgi:hypothetical protein
MKYLCLVYQDEAAIAAQPASAYSALADEMLAYDDELRERGYAIASAALQPAHAATTVRVRNGRVSIDDGPFAMTEEQLSGIYLIEARDLNDAIRVAARMPPARRGGIEVRPLKEFTVRSSGSAQGEEL